MSIRIIDRQPEGSSRTIGIAVARFNAEVTELMLQGCLAALAEHQVEQHRITIARVPGAWELPLICQQMAASGRFDAVIAIGAVVRGATAHFDFISSECAHGLQQASLNTGVPIAFGVLTPENAEQAFERADPERKNKGREAALAALEMIGLCRAVAND
ncbi:MAG: 6,7-dimethyl-8-ribityllumazine synthase [Pseudomonadota bacterium]